MFYSLVRIEQCPLRCGVSAIQHPVPTIRNGAVTALGRVTDASPDRTASDDRLLYPVVKYGWPYTLVFVLGYILAFNFKLTYLSRRAQVSTRFLGVFLAFAMTASPAHRPLLFREGRPDGSRPARDTTFLLVTPAFKVLWAAVAGSGLVAIIGVGILILYGTVAGQQTYKQYSRHEGEAAKMHLQLHSLRNAMRKFFEFSLSFILLFVSIRAGWPWPIVFVVAFFLACALGLFSFTEVENANSNRYLILRLSLRSGSF